MYSNLEVRPPKQGVRKSTTRARFRNFLMHVRSRILDIGESPLKICARSGGIGEIATHRRTLSSAVVILCVRSYRSFIHLHFGVFFSYLAFSNLARRALVSPRAIVLSDRKKRTRAYLGTFLTRGLKTTSHR